MKNRKVVALIAGMYQSGKTTITEHLVRSGFTRYSTHEIAAKRLKEMYQSEAQTDIMLESFCTSERISTCPETFLELCIPQITISNQTLFVIDEISCIGEVQWKERFNEAHPDIRLEIIFIECSAHERLKRFSKKHQAVLQVETVDAFNRMEALTSQGIEPWSTNIPLIKTYADFVVTHNNDRIIDTVQAIHTHCTGLLTPKRRTSEHY